MTKVGSRPALGEHARDQARGGGLAVRAGDRDRVAEAHQLAQHFGARHHRNALGERRGDFRVGAVDGARHHHHVGLAEVLGGVADENRRAEARRGAA